jgi:hypothetical protein
LEKFDKNLDELSRLKAVWAFKMKQIRLALILILLGVFGLLL